MLSDLTWRKYPLDLLMNENMAVVEAAMPKGFEYAPYMFYITALKKADNDGVFDLEDGVIFARLMRVENIEVVFLVANLMQQRHLIYRINGECNKCGLVDWEYPKNEKPRTIAERRAIVEKQIQEAKNVRICTEPLAVLKNSKPVAGPEELAALENPELTGLENAAQLTPDNAGVFTAPKMDGNFICPENDKNAENVVIEKMDDKNTKNVVKNFDTEREREKRDYTDTEEKEKTHTLDKTERLEKESVLACAKFPIDFATAKTEKTAMAGEKSQDVTDSQNLETDGGIGGSSEELGTEVEKAMTQGESDEGMTDGGSCKDYLNKFFVENCYGFVAKKSAWAMNKLAAEIDALADEENPSETIAALICAEFKRMHDGKVSDYFKDYPMRPSYMLKPRAWEHLMTYAAKILARNKGQNNFLKAAQKAKTDYEAERESVDVALADEYAKYGIDPADPNKATKIIQAKAQEQSQVAYSEETASGIDIF